MIILKPIDVEVQKTINEKIEQSSKVDGVGYLENRTTWARMISLSKVKDQADQPIVISAGLEETEPVTDNSNLQPIRGKLAGSIDDVYRGTYNRPIPGLKSITTQVQGQFKATRTAEVRWVVWDTETLERLTPFFLTPGASVALEFGWMWDGHKPQELIYDSWGTLDAKKIGDMSEFIRKEGKGHQDMYYGTVSNFEWTGRDDGGFDCTTKIVSLASNIFGKPATSVEGDESDIRAFEIDEDMANQIRRHRNFAQFRDGEVDDVLDDTKFSEAFTKSGLDGIAAMKNQGAEGVENVIKSVTPDILYSNITDILKDIALRVQAGNNTGGRTKNVVYEDTIILQYDEGDKEWIGPYVSYGWFEDNLLLPFVSSINETNELVFKVRSVEKIGKTADGKDLYESVRIRNDVNNLFTTNASEVIIPGQWPMNTNFEEMSGKDSNESRDSLFRKTSKTRQAYMLLAKKVAELPTFSVSGAQRSDVTPNQTLRDLGKSESTFIETELFGNVTPFKTTDTVNDEGYLRNLLIHAKLIEEELGSASSFQNGMENLLKRISGACGGIWDFKIAEADDGQTLRVVEESTRKVSAKDLLDNKNLDAIGNVRDDYQNNGLMVFPAWQTNSIVYNQQLVAKIPDEFQISAIYGKFGKSEELVTKDPTLNKNARKLAELYNRQVNNDVPKVDDILFPNLRRIIGNPAFQIGYNKLPENGIVTDIEIGDKDGIPIDFNKVIRYYKEQQILDILNDGVDYDKSKDEDRIQWWEELVAVFNRNKIDYKFLYSEDGKLRKHYRDAMFYFIKDSPTGIQGTSDLSAFLNVELTIDGTGGIYSGEAFSSTYIPKTYREKCVFQIMDVSHQLDPSGWKTTLRGLMIVDHTRTQQTESLEKMEQPYKSFTDYLTKTMGTKSPYHPKPIEEPKEIEKKQKKGYDKDATGMRNRRQGGSGRML